MRITLVDIPSLALLFLPIWVGYNGYGVIWSTIWVVLWLIFRQAMVMKSVFTPDTRKAVLVTLPISHYVDKVRWCLEKAGIDFEEEKDIGIFGVFFFGRMVPTLKVPGKRISIQNSSDILRYIYGIQLAENPERVKFLEPTAETVEWEKKIDKMGSDLRRYVYYHGLVVPDNSDELALKVWSLEEDDVPGWQKILLKATLPLLKAFLIKVLNVNTEGAEDGLKKSQVFFKEMDNLLNDGRKYILGGNEPTYIDYSFAALAALLAFPDQYCGNSISPTTRAVFNGLSPAYQAEKNKFRKTPSGQFVLRMYKDHRL